MTFDEIVELIELDDWFTLSEMLPNLDPVRRKELAAELVAYERVHRAGDDRWSFRGALAVAGAALLPNASTLAPWLARNENWQSWESTTDPIDAVIEVLRHRDPPWLPDLTARVAVRMRPGQVRNDLYQVARAFSGDVPPDSDGFILHVLRLGPAEFARGYDALIPRMLEVVGAGAALERQQWPQFLLGRADRGVLLDGCLARLQQGGRPAEMDGFLALHEAIGPTMDETAEHARDYVAMLPDSRSTVATLAQNQLRWLDDARRLDFDLLCDATRWVFGRTEKKLVRAQLTWLGKHAKQHPDEVVLTAAQLFAHESADLRANAVELIVKHLPDATGPTKAELVGMAGQLPPDLAARLGGVTVAEDAVELAPFAPRPWPEPIVTLDELTREVGSLFGRNSGHVEAVTAERIVDAVVRFAWQDREAVAAAFEPIYEKYPWIQNRSAYEYCPDHAKRDVRTEFTAIIAAVSERPRGRQITAALDSARQWLAQLKRAQTGSVGEQLALRLQEIARFLVYSPRPALVSVPTEMSGLLGPATLLERLAKAEAEDWEPWPRDLRQAYHRLPRDVGAEAFTSLSGNAGRLLREWLQDRTDPVVELVERTRTTPDYYYRPAVTEKRLLVTVTPGLSEPEQRWYGFDEWGPMIEWWPAVLPAHREVVAAHLVPHLAYRRASKGGDGPLLPMLAEADGAVGVGMHLALAYGLGAELTVNRAYAVDALLTLAARDQLDGKALGELLGLLLERGDLALNRIVPGLRDVARSGALRQVWDVVKAALPKLWTHNRVADVVELAVELAQRLKPGGEVDGLAEVAARKGAGKAVVQARRLVAALG